jgi:hypothetical protein
LDEYKSDVSDEEVLLIEQETIDNLIAAINAKFNAGPEWQFNGNIQDLYNYILSEYMWHLYSTDVGCDSFYINGIDLYNSDGEYERTINDYDGPLYNVTDFIH